METSASVYVAGGGGLVGSAIVRALRNAGYTNVKAPSRAELDLLDQKAVENFFTAERIEYVILSAARVGGIKANLTYPADFLHENLVIQENVMWQAYKAGVKKLIFLGSSCIYPREAPQPMREEYFMTGPVEPTNEGYAIAKIAGMKLAEKIYEQFGVPFITCMPTNTYGENDHFDPERGHVIPGLMRRMHEAKISNTPEVVVWGTGNARREFLYVDDLAEAVVFLMNSYDGKNFLNIGTGEDVAIKELAQQIQKTVGYTGKLTFDTTKPDGMPRKLLDVSKIQSFGWKARTSLEEGLQKTYAWYLKHGA